jgi:hypothetical protein
VADQQQGETIDQYRIRMLEEQYKGLDGKLDIVVGGMAEIKHTQDDLVAASKTKSTNASTLRIGITVGLIVAGGGAVITVGVTLVNAVLHLAQAGGTP